MKRVAGLLFVLGLLACLPARHDDAEELRLVLDAGSSGLRACAFLVGKSCSLTSCRCQVRPARACFRTEGGLAEAPDARAIRQQLEQSLTPWRSAGPNRISRAALLATGGFRRLPAAQAQQKMQLAGEALRDLLPGTVSSAAVISGEQEAQFAWLTVQLERGADDHAILETGGATVQYADGVQMPRSTPCGINEIYARLPDQRSSSSCRSGASGDYQACREAVGALLKRAECSLPRHFGATLFVLGAAWGAFAAPGAAIDLKAIDELGLAACRQNAASASPHGNRRCFLAAYQRETLQLLQADRAIISGESWPRGASISAPFFPDCSR
ncbi:MAG: hypothetical protein K1X75_12290 [Leptospirales bacterium]|nr:hypothetical protein [Leptospirales bacterium]